MPAWTDIVGAVGGAIGAAAGIVAIVLAAKAWGTSKTQLRQQIYHDLMSEYRTPRMGIALRKIGQLKKGATKTEAAGFFAVALASDSELVKKGKLQEDEHLKFDRRLVYQYFHQVALTAEKDDAFKALIYRIWTKTSLDIIPKAIIPIELDDENPNNNIDAIEVKDYSSHLQRLQKLYDDAPPNAPNGRLVGSGARPLIWAVAWVLVADLAVSVLLALGVL